MILTVKCKVTKIGNSALCYITKKHTISIKETATNGVFWKCLPSVPGISPISILPLYHVQRYGVYAKVLYSVDLTEHIVPSLPPSVALLF